MNKRLVADAAATGEFATEQWLRPQADPRPQQCVLLETDQRDAAEALAAMAARSTGGPARTCACTAARR